MSEETFLLRIADALGCSVLVGSQSLEVLQSRGDVELRDVGSGNSVVGWRSWRSF